MHAVLSASTRSLSSLLADAARAPSLADDPIAAANAEDQARATSLAT